MLATLLLLAPAGAGAVGADARAAVEAVTAEALAVLRDGELDLATKQLRMEKIAETHFNFDLITKLVLARNWRTLSEAQRAEFKTEFKRHLSATYGRRIDAYADEEVEVVDALEHSNGDVTVKTRIVGGAVDGAAVDYRMRRNDEKWYAIDVIIEGVSMIANFRSQIQEIVSSRGADHLIESLREKNTQDVSSPGS